MELVNGMRVIVSGRYEDFTDHLDGCVVTVVHCSKDDQGFILVEDDAGTTWYVQAEHVRPVDG